jgi:radical SAM protein with 4Fe4S-binding SPASM domain
LNADFEGLSDPLLRAVIKNNCQFEPCGCGWTSARIQEDLSVTPCVFLKGEAWSAGSIAEKCLEDVRDHANFKKIRNRFPKKCRTCRYTACRGGCYSRAFLQRGTSDEVDAFCPFLDNKIEPLINEIKQKIVIRDSDKVHHGYLCTLITKPKEGKK